MTTAELGAINTTTDLPSSGWQVIYETTVTSAVNKIVATGLNGDTDGQYMINLKIKNGRDGTNTFFMRPNDDSNAVYGYRRVYATSASGSCFTDSSVNRTTVVLGVSTLLGDYSLCDIEMDCTKAQTSNRLLRSYNSWRINGEAIDATVIYYYAYAESSTEITSMAFQANNGTGFGVGSTITIWGKYQ